MMRTADGRFAKAEPTAKPWTILATDRRRHEVKAVNRRRSRLISHRPATQIRFESEADANEYLARLPINPRWSFKVTTA